MRQETRVDNAGHLELLWGDRIREGPETCRMSPQALSQWMLLSLHVSVPARICQTWLSRDWSTSGKLLVSEQVEELLGDRLRYPS